MGLISEAEPLARPAAPRPPREFRPDIQALRAVAVMAVVIYHLWPRRMPGGFVGVDVFFVISGFLITQHLVGEIERTGRIGLTEFWARRIRRLLPAAFTVLAVSTVALFVLMPTVTWRENIQEIGASAAYVENWLLANNAVDYLAAENSATLVQHYWSLSVEEQFYLCWPVLLLAALAVGRRVRRPSARLAVGSALALVAAGSFAVSVLLTHADPARAFFVTPTRAWEFALGGLLSVLPAARLGTRGPAVRAAAGWAGIALIGWSVFFVTGEQPFPGTIALVPVLGAVLVLAAGTSPARWSPAPMAGLAPVQWLGNYSYSIYLWHWPLIIVAPWVLHEAPTWPAKLVLLAASLLLAWATKRWVEDPVRTGARWRVRRWPSYTFAAAGMVVLVALAVLTTRHVDAQGARAAATALARVESHAACYGAAAIVEADRCPEPFRRPAGFDTAFAAADLSGSEECQQHKSVARLRLCTFGDEVAPVRTVVVVGNSHSLRLVPALDLYGRQHDWKIVLAAKTDCLGLTNRPVGGQSADNSCLAWSGQLRRTLLTMPDLDGVVFASHLDARDYLAGRDASPAAVAAAGAQVRDLWQALSARGVAVMVAEDVPGVRPDSGPECVARAASDDDPCALPRADVVRPNLVTDLAAAHPDLVRYLPLSRYFCDAGTCHALVGGVVVYSDGHHLTGTYSRSMSEYLGAEIARALAP